MKRRIFTFLLAAALVLLTACSSRGTEPPVRIGEATGNASFNRSYSLTEAFEDYPLFTYGNQLLLFLRHSQTDWGEAYIQYPGAYVNVCAFITTMYVANADDGSRCFVDRFGLMTYEELMNNPGSATLAQPLSRMQESTVEELRADLEKTDPLLAESLSFGERQNSFLEPYVYTQDALETLFASLNQG